MRKNQRAVFLTKAASDGSLSFKLVLNWAHVLCSPNILRTLQRTMIRFLIELLVRWIWFGQSRLYFILNWLVMRCKLQPELAADAQQTAWSKMEAKIKSIYFHHPSQGNSTNYLLSHSGSPRQGCASHKSTNKFPPKRAKNLTTPSSIFFFIHRRVLLSANQRQWLSNRANVPRTCWAKFFGPRI